MVRKTRYLICSGLHPAARFADADNSSWPCYVATGDFAGMYFKLRFFYKAKGDFEGIATVNVFIVILSFHFGQDPCQKLADVDGSTEVIGLPP